VRLARVLALIAVYFAAGKLGLSLAFLDASASAVWPPTGIAIAALLLFGRDLWPGVALGAFLVNISTSGAVAASLGIALGNTLEALAAVALVNAFAGGVRAFERATDVLRFAMVAGLAAPAISATVGVASLVLTGLTLPSNASAVWLTWWLGDAAGAVVVAPALILLWTDRRQLTSAQAIETSLLFGADVLVALVIFGGWSTISDYNYPLAFVSIPLVLWSAFRLGQRVTSVAMLVVSGIAVWGTLRGYGPYGKYSPNESLLLVQTFTGVVAVTTAAMATVVDERRRLLAQLERRVSERTAQLHVMNTDLRSEIAERERAQAALQASEARLLEAQAVAHVGSWEWDIATNSIWWSEELYKIYGVSRDTFPASYEAYIERVHPDDRQKMHGVVVAALADGHPYTTEHRVIRPDGTERILAARGRVVTDESGRPTRMLGVGQDVTELRHADDQRHQLHEEQVARRQAEAANRLKDEFLAMISHELRTPLNAVLGWAQMLSAGSLDGPAAAKALKVIERNAQAQARLIDDLLDVSRFAAGQVALDMRPVDIGGIVKTALDAIEPVAGSRGIRAELSGSFSDALTQGDPERLSQVFGNLLANALKFTPEGGLIRVAVETLGSEVVVRVSDSGRGINPADLKRIFEPFWQADSSSTRTHGGLGLGLAIVRYLVEAHGGQVRAESDGTGKGASFVVTLPRQGRSDFPMDPTPWRGSEARSALDRADNG
jgi:PAS domain S-box-containing protein